MPCVYWYEGYKQQVTAPKPAGPGLTEEEVVVIFNRIVDRLILLSKQKYRFESRRAGVHTRGLSPVMRVHRATC